MPWPVPLTMGRLTCEWRVVDSGLPHAHAPRSKTITCSNAFPLPLRRGRWRSASSRSSVGEDSLNLILKVAVIVGLWSGVLGGPVAVQWTWMSDLHSFC